MKPVLLRGPRRTTLDRVPVGTVVACACGAVVLARLLFACQPLQPDEGGFLLVAQNWHTGGEFLYGDYFVDRPPLLMLIFRIAPLCEWDGTIRMLSIPFAVAMVLAAARAAYLAAGPRAARYGAVVAGALVSSPALGANQAAGELFAVPFVMASVAVILDGWHRRVGVAQWRCALVAGVLGGAASLVKQNFLDALVFSALLVTVEVVQARAVTARYRRVAAGTIIGAALPYLVVAGWLHLAGIGGSRLWADLVAFRGDAFAVIWHGSMHAPVHRAVQMLELGMLSAMLPLVGVWVGTCRFRRTLTVQDWAVTGCLLFGLLGIVGWQRLLAALPDRVVPDAGPGSRDRGRGGPHRNGHATLVDAHGLLQRSRRDDQHGGVRDRARRLLPRTHRHLVGLISEAG